MENRILEAAVCTLDKHKATDLTALRVAELTSIADHFLLATGTGPTQVRALADYLEEELRTQGFVPLRSEGYTAGNWITVDYGDLLVHIFTPQTREFYALERLWCDAQTVDITGYMAI